jgi:UDP-glucose 4-epimerase
MSCGDVELEKIVVTGASGFLGRVVVAGLKESGPSVVGVCRQPMSGMQQVTNYLETPAADLLIHLAEESDRTKVNQIGETYAQQVADTVRQMCVRAGRVIYASSGAVYGDEGNTPFTTDMPVHASDLYSRSKIENECIVLDAGGAVLRLSNLYGRGMSPNNVFSDIMRQIPGTGALYVRDVKPVRDFLSVTDAARAFVLAAKTSCNGIMNVGSGIGTSIETLARLALQAACEEHREIVATNSLSRHLYNVLEVSETQRRLGWSCASSIHDDFPRLFGRGVKLVER